MPENANDVKDLAIIFEKDKSKIYQRINEIDDKHDKNYNSLELLLKTFIESQKPLNEGINNITNELKSINTNITDVTKRVEDVERTVASHDAYIAKRSTANEKIIIAFISGVFGLGGSAFGIVQLFIK